jgi:hypothetical protein
MTELVSTHSSSQTPEILTQLSQSLVQRYETLLVTLDIFELNLVRC